MGDTIEITAPKTSHGINEIDHEKHLLELQRNILELIVTNNDHDQNLKSICLTAEEMLPNAVASIMLYDKENTYLDVRCAPSIPQAAIDQLNGQEGI